MVVMNEGCSSCKFHGCEVSVKQDLDNDIRKLKYIKRLAHTSMQH